LIKTLLKSRRKFKHKLCKFIINVLDIFQFSFAYLAENISKTANVLVNQWLTTFIIILIMMLMMVVIIIIIIIIINKEIMW